MCEEEIVLKLHEDNLLEMILKLERSGIVTESTLEKCRNLFIKNFDLISG